MLLQSSGWLNLVQVNAEVTWRRKCTDYTRRVQKLWSIGATEKGADFLPRQTALFRVTSGEKCERSATLNIHDFPFGYSGWEEDSNKPFHIHVGTDIKPLVPDLYAWRNVQKTRISMRAV